MRQRRFAILLFVAVLAAFCGCASVEPEEKPLSPFDHPLPKPTDITINASLRLDLPGEVAKQANIPPQVLGKLHVTLLSKAIEAWPPRSRFDGNVTVTFTDPEEKRKYIDFASELQGVYDGSPNEGFFKAFEQLLEIVGLFHGVVPGQGAPK